MSKPFPRPTPKQHRKNKAFTRSNQILQSIHDEMKRKNSSFSLRAFAKLLVISPSHLSQVLAGKKLLSLSAAQRIAQKLKLTQALETLFISLVELELAPEQSKAPFQRKVSIESQKLNMKRMKPSEKIQSFGWEHLFLLVAMDLKNEMTAPDLKLISNFLKQDILRTQKIMSELLNGNLIQKSEGGFQRTHKEILFEAKKSSAILRSIHSSYLTRAQELLERRNASERYSITEFYSIPTEKVRMARDLIETLLDELSGLSHSSSNGPRNVLELSLHLNSFGEDEVFSKS